MKSEYENRIAFKLVELALAEHYAKELRQAIHIPVGSFGRWDGRATVGSFSYEAKFDIMARETGNFAFEISYCGHPSGVTSTEALEWAQMVPLDGTTIHVTQFAVERLRGELKNLPTYYGGDGRKSGLKILSREVAAEFSTGTFYLALQDWSTIRPSWK